MGSAPGSVDQHLLLAKRVRSKGSWALRLYSPRSVFGEARGVVTKTERQTKEARLIDPGSSATSLPPTLQIKNVYQKLVRSRKAP